MIHSHMQRFKFIDFMVIEVRFFKKKKNNKMNMEKMWKALFEILQMSYITDLVYSGAEEAAFQWSGHRLMRSGPMLPQNCLDVLR